jgi:hypothetical protein
MNLPIEKINKTFVRGILTDRTRNKFLALINNRIDPGSLTIMLPGGQIIEGTNLDTLAQHLLNDLGIRIILDPSNCKFIANRVYEFKETNGEKNISRVNFFSVDIDDAVPKNFKPESILSISWLTLTDLHRYLELNNITWKLQLGALDAIELVLDPLKSKLEDDKITREIMRQDGGVNKLDPVVSSMPIKLPY